MSISLDKYTSNIAFRSLNEEFKDSPSCIQTKLKPLLESDVVVHNSLTPNEQEKNRRKRKAINIALAIAIPLGIMGLYTLAIKSAEKLILQSYAGKSAREQSHKILQPGIAGNVKTVELKTANNLKIECWDINPKNAKKYVLFCHGNGQHLSKSQDIYKEILHKGYGVLAVDYAGYAKNKGSVTEKNLMLDGQAAYDYLTNTKRISPKQIGIMGYSLGGAVATDIASKNDCKFVILLDTFNNLVDAARNSYRYFNLPISDTVNKLINKLPTWVFPINNTFRSDKKIQNVKAPITIIHAKDDQVIPINLARKLQNEAAKTNFHVQFITLPGGGKKHSYDSQKYKEIRNALSKY